MAKKDTTMKRRIAAIAVGFVMSVVATVITAKIRGGKTKR